ncbi:MAG: DUF433 domain-containing protein [Thermoflexales bacterium]|nr:DUF433 domain-containing protein [Thermoflexales bacterium]
MSKPILAEPQAVETVEVEPPEHPYIVRVEGILGGEPVIRGTRVPVRAIALHYKAGETIDEILEAYPHLPPAAVVDAISYYLDHQEEIEQLIEENRPERVIEEHHLKIGPKGEVIFPPSSRKDAL